MRSTPVPAPAVRCPGTAGGLLGRAGRAVLLAAMASGILLSAWQAPLAAEATREDLVAALERGPGPSRGSRNAPIVMVGFSDFQCGYCRQFWHETFPSIDAQYIRPGTVRFVYRHLAVLGEASLVAAEAASCAADQGKFWEYHGALFGNSAPFVLSAARLKQVAVALGLDGKAFAACLDSRKYAQRVEAETFLGHALGARGTPAFLVNGQLLIGALPFEAFREHLDGLLRNPRDASPAPVK